MSYPMTETLDTYGREMIHETRLTGRRRLREIERLRRYFRGHRRTIVHSVMRTYYSEIYQYGDSADVEHSKRFRQCERSIPDMNRLKPIINRRIAAVPDGFTFKPKADTPGAEDFVKDFTEWATGRNCTGGKSLQAIFPKCIAAQEKDGSTACVLGLDENENVWLEVRDTAGAVPDVDPMTSRIRGWTFMWASLETTNDGQDSLEVFHEEEINDTERAIRVHGEKEQKFSHKGGVVPVAHAPRDDVEGAVLGTSGIAELEAAHNTLVHAMTFLFRTGKYDANGVFCRDPADQRPVIVNKAGKKQKEKRVQISPGAYIDRAMKRLPSGANGQVLTAIADRALQELHYEGHVPAAADSEADMRSGKAVTVATGPMLEYVETKVNYLRDMLEQIAFIWGRLSGRLTEADDCAPVTVEIERPDNRDFTDRNQTAQLFRQLRQDGEIAPVDLFELLKANKTLDESIDAAAMAERAQDAKVKAVEVMVDAGLPMPGDDEDDDDEDRGVPDEEDDDDESPAS